MGMAAPTCRSVARPSKRRSPGANHQMVIELTDGGYKRPGCGHNKAHVFGGFDVTQKVGRRFVIQPGVRTEKPGFRCLCTVSIYHHQRRLIGAAQSKSGEIAWSRLRFR